VSDEEFAVALEVDPIFELSPRYEALVYFIKIDGIPIDGQVVERRQFQYGPFRVQISQSRQLVNKTQMAFCKLKFSQLKKGTF
jgi:hypothetical protein